MPDASPINAGSLFVLAAVAVAGLAAFLAQNFEPNPNARVSLGLEAAAGDNLRRQDGFADRTPTGRAMWCAGGRAATRSTRA